MAETLFAPIHHIGESLLQNAAARVAAGALVKADVSAIDNVTYAAAVATAKAAVQVDVDAEVAFHDGLAPLYVALQDAVTLAETTAAKAAIVAAMAGREVYTPLA